MPKTLTGAELELDDAPARECDLFVVDGNNLAYRAYFALPDERAARVHEHALQAARRLPAERSRGRVGHAARAPRRGRRGGRGRLQGRPEGDAGPAPRAVPALPPDRRGVRLSQSRVRGVGGR